MTPPAQRQGDGAPMEGLPIDAANLLLDIHPLTVLLVTALGGIVGGIVGLILAVVQHMLR